MDGRQALIDEMLKARTPEEVAAAERAAERWMEEHPHDSGFAEVARAGEQLYMMKSALETLDERPA